MLNSKPLAIDGVALISPTRFEDERGYFVETFNAAAFADAIGRRVDFVQDNESLSRRFGTVRGLHFQAGAAAQGKLVRVTAGRVLDVVVDLRRSSATYGQHVAVELDAGQGRQLWVPEGLAHGFCTLEPDTVLGYKVTAPYAPEADRSLSWRDPALAIDWPIEAGQAVVSAKDAAAPDLAQLEEHGDVFP